MHNPAVLTKSGSNTWSKLAGVQRLEIEDPEATLSTIPKQLVTELRSLESLSFTWTKIKSLPSALFQLPLNSLYLQRNDIKTLSGIEKASQLAVLDISNNRLDCLPKTFGQLQNLVTLNLSGNGLHELPESIASLSQLKTLDCSCNKIRALPSSLGNIIQLTSLDVSTNHLTSLPESIGFLPQLEDLRVRSNQLTSLPESFAQLNRLNSLLLRHNKFTDVPEQLSNMTNLQSLNMRENMIGHMDRAINPLKYLILDQNCLQQIDVGILQCPNLQYLSLKSNNIVEVTGGVSRLTNIRSLNLSNNAIAEVPAGLDRLPHLRHLSLCSTKIRTVPLAVACMPSLKTLELEQCNELEIYLNIAYKSSGLPGVIDYLRKNEPPTAKTRPTTMYPVEPDTSDTSPASEEAPRPSVRIRNRSQEKGKSMFPADAPELETTNGNEPVLLNAGRLSIIPGTSVTPPEPEAMLQVEIGSGEAPILVHKERRSILPPERPAKPHKPSGLADRQSQRVSTSGRAESASSSSPEQPESQLDTANGINDVHVIATIPQFGDLTSSSTTDVSPQQQSSKDRRQSAAQGDTAAVKNRDEPDSLAAGNTYTPPPTERPAKPHKPPALADGRRLSTNVKAQPASPSSPVQREPRLSTVEESSTGTSDPHAPRDGGQTAAPTCDNAAVVQKPDEQSPTAAGNTFTVGASAASGKKPRPPPVKKKPAMK